MICDRPNVVRSGKVTVNSALDKKGKGDSRTIWRKPFGRRNNIWRFDTQKNNEHPAPFPLKLANDHIISWSNEGDTVFDCFMGSGTTGMACANLDRNFIGIELDAEYFKIAENRIDSATRQMKIDFKTY